VIPRIVDSARERLAGWPVMRQHPVVRSGRVVHVTALRDVRDTLASDDGTFTTAYTRLGRDYSGAWGGPRPLLPISYDGATHGRLRRALPELPEQVLAERSVMMRTMLIYTCAEFERVLAEGNPSPWPHWPVAAHSLIDGIVALMQGPATRLD
jgi:hypothetical protein